jgi:hypothetical protein
MCFYGELAAQNYVHADSIQLESLARFQRDKLHPTRELTRNLLRIQVKQIKYRHSSLVKQFTERFIEEICAFLRLFLSVTHRYCIDTRL